MFRYPVSLLAELFGGGEEISLTRNPFAGAPLPFGYQGPSHMVGRGRRTLESLHNTFEGGMHRPVEVQPIVYPPGAPRPAWSYRAARRNRFRKSNKR